MVSISTSEQQLKFNCDSQMLNICTQYFQHIPYLDILCYIKYLTKLHMNGVYAAIKNDWKKHWTQRIAIALYTQKHQYLLRI